jgi:DNA-binding GntR family transcriptional regulator
MPLVECVPNFSEGRRADVVSAIRDAIAARDPAGARAAMHHHLECSHQRFARDFGELPQPKGAVETKPALRRLSATA